MPHNVECSEMNIREFAMKPISMQDLAKVVRKVLDEK